MPATGALWLWMAVLPPRVPASPFSWSQRKGMAAACDGGMARRMQVYIIQGADLRVGQDRGGGAPLFAHLRSVAEISIAMGMVVYLARLGLVHADVRAGTRLVILVFLGIAVYLALLRWREPDVLAEIGRLRRRTSTA